METSERMMVDDGNDSKQHQQDEDTLQFSRDAEAASLMTDSRVPESRDEWSEEPDGFFSNSQVFHRSGSQSLRQVRSQDLVQGDTCTAACTNAWRHKAELSPSEERSGQRPGETSGASPITRLPTECLVAIFKKLDPIREEWPQWPGIRLGTRNPHPNAILACASVCRLWRRIVDSAVWHLKFAGAGCKATKTVPACLAWAEGSLLFMKNMHRFRNLAYLELHRISSKHWELVFDTVATHCSALVALELVMVKTGEVHPYGWMPRAITCEILTRICEGCSNLRSLVLDDCFTDDMENMSTLPEALFEMPHLNRLYLASVRYSTMSESLGRLTNLEQLDLHNFSNLAAIPNSIGELCNLKRLTIDACSEITVLPESLGNLPSLEWLKVRHLAQLTKLPDSLGKLSSLQKLTIAMCDSLEELPECLSQLTMLGVLRLENCPRIQALPDWLGQLCGLWELELCDVQITQLPQSLGALSSLQELYLFQCRRLTALPSSLARLSSLRCLGLCNCESLSSIPAGVGELLALEHLAVRMCGGLQQLPWELTRLTKLKMLDLVGSAGLQGSQWVTEQLPWARVLWDSEGPTWEEMDAWALKATEFYARIRDAD